MTSRLMVLATALGLLSGAALADATVPTRDIPGIRDSPILKRYEGSFIVSGARQAFTDFRLPLSKLEKTDRQDTSNNNIYAPKEQKELEGQLTRLTYVVPAGRSPLEVLRNYQDEIERAGGKVLFQCRGADCGGDALKSTSGGGGNTSLMQYFLYESDLKDPSFSNGSCALTTNISDQRYISAEMPHPDGEAHVAVHTFQLGDSTYCKALAGRTVALVHLLEPKARERRMTTVSADEMARSIGQTGRVALYGILFDTAKTDLKPESKPTLDEIAALMKADPKLAVIVVGHTDNQGGYDYNLDLSRRRAEAVLKALTGSYKVDGKRLKSLGVGMAAPTASNDDEPGRAKNRRVELVKLN